MNIFLLTLVSILTLYYQTLIVNNLSIYSYIPNIIVPTLIFCQFYLNNTYHSILFFLIGLALDSINPPMFGSNVLSFMILSYLISFIKAHLDLHIFANKIALITLSNAVFFLIYYIVNAIAFQPDFLFLLANFFLSLILNTLLSFIVISILDFIRMLKLDTSND